MLRQQIVKVRKEQGFTQGILAEKIGVRQATISEFESGKRSLGSDILEKIINILNIDIMNIIEEKNMQLKLSDEIAKELLSKGVENIDSLTKETIHMMTKEKFGDYILSLNRVSEEEYKKLEKQDKDFKTWNMFFVLLKFDFEYNRKSLRS